ncbi:MAG: hypothetical protein MPI95_08230 [Nitrosopumilus sp.]|nr:hypothetical protein [Nitrosopumilus sp.]
MDAPAPGGPGLFSAITADLQGALGRDTAQIRLLLKRSPAQAYARIVEIGREVGARYGIKLVVNFPKEGRIEETQMYGRRDLSLIIDYSRKRFPIDRSIIKARAVEMLGGVMTEDAYMYENKEGVRVYTDSWKIDVLPHSFHVWTEFDPGVTAFCDWLMADAYGLRAKPA